METPEECVEHVQLYRFDAFLVKFERISHFFLVFLLLNLNRKMFVGIPAAVCKFLKFAKIRE